MIFDKQLFFSEAQDLAVAAGTVNSTNVIDLGAAPTVPGGLVGSLPIDPGRGMSLQVFCQIMTAFASGTSMRIQLVESAAAALTTPTIIDDTGVILTASLTIGKWFNLGQRVPPTRTPLRYLGLLYIMAGTHTTGTVTAGLLFDRQTAPTVPATAI